MLTRRALTRGAAAALAMPAVLRAHDALASSGEVNVFVWGEYFDKNTLLPDFQAKTGIRVNLSTYGSNEEAENKLRAAGGKGFDVLFPSVDTGPNYYKDGLLQEIDERRFDANRVLPSIYRNSITLGATYRGKRYLMPFDWGTEAITYDGSKFDKKSGELSYGDLWADGLDKKVALRQKSIFTSIAIWLDATGRVKTNRALDMYKSEDEARRVFEACLAFAASKKKNFGAYWNNANEATAAFTDAGCVIGQTWDTTGILLNRKTDRKWKFGMPKEGGLAWTDTFGIPAGAQNLDQAYALANFLYSPEAGAAFTNSTGYNTCAVGAEKHLNDEARTAFEMSYAPGTIDGLWWWPIQTPFFSRLRGEYVEKLTNA
jgi:spermidine/putrescine transport system substrate-binding protein